MLTPIALCCVDGMSDQTMLELLVGNITNISSLQDAHGAFLDILEWPGVTLASEGVVDIDFQPQLDELYFDTNDDAIEFRIGPGGRIDLQWIPPSTTAFYVTSLAITGIVDTAVLPLNLEIFDIGDNHFTGEFAIHTLPRKLRRIYIYTNDLEGSLDIPALPRWTQSFRAGHNKFCGEIDLRGLPDSLIHLDISDAQLSGAIDLEKLPSGLVEINLKNNQISQQTLLVEREISRLCIDREKFDEVIDRNGKDLMQTVQ